MTAAFGTLVFLTILWMLVVVGAAVLEESGAKIAAALKGRHGRGPALVTAPVRMRTRVSARAAMRATPRLRAAA
jgi:hypothetical protein